MLDFLHAGRAGKLTLAAALFAVLLGVGPALAAEKNGYQVNGFVGSFSTGVPIAVPAFHGIEPRISLSYSSEGRNGIVGVGWGLNGFSQLNHRNESYNYIGTGWPLLLELDGQPLVACTAGSSYPSCAAGGTHYTSNESYLKILKASESSWTVYGKDGTRTIFNSLGSPGDYTWKLGQAQTIDTHGNTVNYTWWNPDGGTAHYYPSTVSYNGYTIEFLYETRPDVISTPVRTGVLRTINRRLKTIKVRLTAGALIRAYKLTYTTAPQSGKSLLASVQQFGKDAAFDGTGTVTGGTSLPAQTFSYTADGSAATFGGDVQQSAAGAPPTAPGTVENVSWTAPNTAVSIGDGSTLQALASDPEFPNWKTAVSTRALSSGAGYAEVTFTPTATGARVLYFGQFIAYIYPGSSGVMFGWGSGWYGPYAVSSGQPIRIEVSPTSVLFKVNGSVVFAETRTVTYPLAMSGYIWGDYDIISNARLSGSLVNNYGVDCAGSKRYVGDFNGDGRQDSLCKTSSNIVAVTLATATGFAPPAIWGYSPYQIEVGDFNGDGKTDLLAYQPYWGSAQYYVYPSTGSAFGPQSAWGSPAAYTGAYGWEVCASYSNNHLGPVGDFNGDGKADATCVFENEEGPAFLVSFSNGSAFSSTYQGACGPGPALSKLDWNGDGLEDLLCTSGGANPQIAGVYGIRPDYGILPLLWRNGSFCTESSYWVGDVNGDGRSDIGCTYGNVVLGGAASDLANQGAFCVSGQTVIEDLDGDGAAEWICNNPGTPADDIQVRKWTGSAFGAATTWRGGFCGGLIRPGDYNGDAKTDLICESTGLVAFAGTKGAKVDLLYAAANGIGGSTQVTYATSTNYSSLNGASPKYVITSASQNDGRGGVDVTNYAYENSFEDDKEKKWNGFSKVTTIHPMLVGETASPTTVTGYIVQGPAAGSLEWMEKRDGANKLLSYVKNTYATTTGARQTSLLTQADNERYDGTTTARCTTWPCGSGKRTRATYAYDNYGNVSEVRNFGLVGATDAGGVESPLSSDETTTTTGYPYNTSLYIVGLPGKISTYAGVGTAGTLLGEQRVLLDGNTAWNQSPTKGDATRTEAWLTGSQYLASLATYDSYGNQLTSTDPTSRTSSATYDATYHLFPVTSTNGASETSTTTWDPLCGVPATSQDPNLQTATLATDALCRPTTTTLPSPYGVVSTKVYSALGNATTQKVRVETPGPDGASDWTESYFDGWGRTYRTIKRGPSVDESIVTDVQFDQRGNVSAQTAPYYANGTPVVTTFEYDGFNRPVRTTLPDGKTRLTSYPAISGDGFFQTVQTNELGQSSTTKLDVFGRVRKSEKYTSLHGNLVTTRNYDLLGRMTSLVDPANNTWSYTFDNLNRNLTKVDPDAGTWTYGYDDAGRVVSQQDAKAQTITLEYDAAGRQTFKRIRPTGGPTGSVSEYVETVYGTSTALFNKGRVLSVATKNGAGVEQTGKLAFEYDSLGRVTKQTRTLDGTNYVLERSYDAAGYLRGIKYPDNDIIGAVSGSGTALGYDEAGRLSSMPGILTSVTYNALGAPLVQTNANGTTTTKTYDANRFWLKTIGTTAPSLTLQNLSYTLNDAGMATVVDSDVANEDWTYGYDEMNRLTSATNGVGANNQTWAYDSLGRFTSNSRVASTFTYPSTGNPRPHAPTQISGGALGTVNFTYDPNGNMLTGNGRTLTWSAENLITQVVANSKTTNFTYGPEGDRIKKVEGTNVAKYPFGDDYEIAPSGTVTKYFNAGFGVIAKKVGTTLYWLHTDRMGSINATTNDAGAEVLRRSYRSYGELLGQTGAHTESLGYIGQRTDEETGLTYLHARYYDPQLGMFVSPDPAGADRNSYRYALSDPANLNDPTGLSTMNCGGAFPVPCNEDVVVNGNTGWTPEMIAYAREFYANHGYWPNDPLGGLDMFYNDPDQATKFPCGSENGVGRDCALPVGNVTVKAIEDCTPGVGKCPGTQSPQITIPGRSDDVEGMLKQQREGQVERVVLGEIAHAAVRSFPGICSGGSLDLGFSANDIVGVGFGVRIESGGVRPYAGLALGVGVNVTQTYSNSSSSQGFEDYIGWVYFTSTGVMPAGNISADTNGNVSASGGAGFGTSGFSGGFNYVGPLVHGNVCR